MKKEQKIIELRTAAKLKVAELRTKIAFAHSEATGERARLMTERAAALYGLKADSTERFDVLAKYRAKLARSNEKLAATLAQLKYEIQQTKSRCEQLCAAAEDDPEPENEQPRQETVYCDGSEHSARIVARRLINKMPHVPEGGSMSVSVIRQDNGEFFVSASEIVKNTDKFVVATFSKVIHDEHYEDDFIRKAYDMFRPCDNKGNSHVAEPFSRALDAVFGGNPLDDIPTARKEGGDE